MRNSEVIRAELAKLQSDKTDIDIQVKEAARYAASTGEYSDSDWFNRADVASKITGKKIRKLMDELSAALKEERKANAAANAIDPNRLSFERTFMRMAREILPRVLYEEIMSSTIEEEASAASSRRNDQKDPPILAN
jgi:hypothetical protein